MQANANSKINSNLRYVPIGIMSMIMQKILESKDLMETVKSLGMVSG
jgi:hypothetical protein